MNVVVKIQDRKALPVWTIPYITGWQLSPDALLTRLVNPQHASLTFPTAFSLDANLNPFSLPPEQWEGMAIQIGSLDERLKNQELPISQEREKWRNLAIETIMQQKTYVWLDEFQKWFDKQSYAFVKYQIDDDGQLVNRPGVRLCLEPLLLKNHALHFIKTELSELKNKAPLNKFDQSLLSYNLGEEETLDKVHKLVKILQNEELKPWLIADPKDPQSEQHWYIPARYFARQLVKEDSILITKRKLLADKVVKSLTNVGIKKRGGKKPFESSTVLKAFANIDFS